MTASQTLLRLHQVPYDHRHFAQIKFATHSNLHLADI
jgi:hypothetical protein